jgi:hypothetical protein
MGNVSWVVEHADHHHVSALTALIAYFVGKHFKHIIVQTQLQAWVSLGEE